MKHLSAEQLLEFADGLAPDARAAAHLRGCPDCRRRMKGYQGVVRDLAVLPAPPPAWRQATFRRLGLLPRERPRAWRWAWAPALVAGLVLAWVLPLRNSRTLVPPAGRTGTGLAQAPAPPPGSAPENRGPITSLAASAARHAIQMASSSHARGVGAKKGLGGHPSRAQETFAFSKVSNKQILPDREISLNFALSLPRIGSLTVLVRDDRGGTVATLFDAPAGPGRVDLSWNGAGAPRGVYTIVASINGSSVSFRSLII